MSCRGYINALMMNTLLFPLPHSPLFDHGPSHQGAGDARAPRRLRLSAVSCVAIPVQHRLLLRPDWSDPVAIRHRRHSLRSRFELDSDHDPAGFGRRAPVPLIFHLQDGAAELQARWFARQKLHQQAGEQYRRAGPLGRSRRVAGKARRRLRRVDPDSRRGSSDRVLSPCWTADLSCRSPRNRRRGM